MTPYLIAYGWLLPLAAAASLLVLRAVTPACANADASADVGHPGGRGAGTPPGNPGHFDLTTELEAIEFDWPKRPTGPYGEN